MQYRYRWACNGWHAHNGLCNYHDDNGCTDLHVGACSAGGSGLFFWFLFSFLWCVAVLCIGLTQMRTQAMLALLSHTVSKTPCFCACSTVLSQCLLNLYKMPCNICIGWAHMEKNSNNAHNPHLLFHVLHLCCCFLCALQCSVPLHTILGGCCCCDYASKSAT